MKIAIDTDAATLTVDGETHPLYSEPAFRALSGVWTTTGWGLKYTYGFTWLGRPVIQMPEDLVRLQELLWAVTPTVVIETGIAHGGSLVFHASVLQALGGGRVIGVDVEIRPHNRVAIEAHPMFEHITMIEGSSTDEAVLAQVRSHLGPDDRVLVVLDSNHTRDHVRAELEHYAPLVSPGSWIVALDGVMQDLADVPGGREDWTWNNPATAVQAFVAEHPEFELVRPARPFDESRVPFDVTYGPSGFLRRRG